MLNDILSINDREILEHAGKVRKKIADEIAGQEYEKFKEAKRLSEKIESLDELERDMKLFDDKKFKK